MTLYRQFGVPWLKDDIHEQLKTMEPKQFGELFGAQVPGVIDRFNGSVFYMTKVLDLIGLRERKYMDNTATHRHRGIGDLMRYAALVSVADSLDFGPHRMLTDEQRTIAYRFSDEVFYALALYIYSLQPPANPNKFDDRAAAGKKLFERENCQSCHPAPLYTNNKLTPAWGFTPPAAHKSMLDIMTRSAMTDSNVALKTRKGTGYYKIPSLKGVWYRGLFMHDGSLAKLEELFDAKRLQNSYVPSGFKGYRVKQRAVPGTERSRIRKSAGSWLLSCERCEAPGTPPRPGCAPRHESAQEAVGGEGAQVGDGGHVGELSGGPLPAAGLATHHRKRRHALHGEGEENEQRHCACRCEISAERALEVLAFRAAFDSINCAEGSHNHFTGRQ